LASQTPSTDSASPSLQQQQQQPSSSRFVPMTFIARGAGGPAFIPYASYASAEVITKLLFKYL
jgi:hypothetical protein